MLFKKFKSDLDVSCSFSCLPTHPETVPHLFWYCVYAKRLWQEILRFINVTLMGDFSLMYKHVLDFSMVTERLRCTLPTIL